MKTSAGDNAVIVDTNAVYTKHKLEYGNQDILKILRKQYPETIPDGFLEMMIPAYVRIRGRIAKSRV